jgi:molybdate transport system substrate-binding protein
MRSWSGRAGGSCLRPTLACALLGLGLGLVASPVAAGEILVAAAASLREPVQSLVDAHRARHPDDRVAVSFGSSSALALQIRHGAPVDVFLSADARLVDDLVAGGWVGDDDHFPLASNRLVVVRPRGSALELGTADDLLQPGLRRFALPPEAVPLGRYGRHWLEARGLLARLMPRMIATEHARATLAAVAQRHADAGIVYVTDARTRDDVEIAWRIPDDEQPAIRYAIARIDSRPGEAAAQQFVALARGPEGARILAAAGFLPNAPEPAGPGMEAPPP